MDGIAPRSRALHRLDRVTARSTTAYVAASLVLGFLIVAATQGFPGSWLAAFHTAAAAVTLVMVFVIQHAQSREQAATQRKLDELVRSAPGADDRLIHIEAASEAELVDRGRQDLEHHGALRNTD